MVKLLRVGDVVRFKGAVCKLTVQQFGSNAFLGHRLTPQAGDNNNGEPVTMEVHPLQLSHVLGVHAISCCMGVCSDNARNVWLMDKLRAPLCTAHSGDGLQLLSISWEHLIKCTSCGTSQVGPGEKDEEGWTLCYLCMDSEEGFRTTDRRVPHASYEYRRND